MGGEFSETDVFIAGGGPAGLAAAIAIRQHGLRVVVADFARPPIDKACGEGLMPNTVTALPSLYEKSRAASTSASMFSEGVSRGTSQPGLKMKPPPVPAIEINLALS